MLTHGMSGEELVDLFKIWRPTSPKNGSGFLIWDFSVGAPLCLRFLKPSLSEDVS